MHRENRENGPKIIRVRENTGNLEILPKHWENTGDLVCSSCKFSYFKGKQYFEIAAKSMLHISRSVVLDPPLLTNRGVPCYYNYCQYLFTDHVLFPLSDCRRGQSLVVHAINEGRQAARQVDHDLMGQSSLAGPGGILTPLRSATTA